MSEVAKPSEGRTVALGGVAMHARRVTLIREPAPLIFAAIGAAGLGIVAATVASSPTEATLLALVAVLGTFLAIALGIAQRAFLAAVILDLALAWNVHLGFRDEVAELGAIGGLGISLTTLALAALYAGWIGELLAGPSSQSLAPRLRAAAPLVAFVGLSAISLLSAGDVELARFKLAVLVQTLLVFVYIAGRVRTRKDVHFVVTFLLVALLVQRFVLIASALGLPVDLAGISSGAGTSPGRSQPIFRNIRLAERDGRSARVPPDTRRRCPPDGRRPALQAIRGTRLRSGNDRARADSLAGQLARVYGLDGRPCVGDASPALDDPRHSHPRRDRPGPSRRALCVQRIWSRHWR